VRSPVAPQRALPQHMCQCASSLIAPHSSLIALLPHTAVEEEPGGTSSNSIAPSTISFQVHELSFLLARETPTALCLNVDRNLADRLRRCADVQRR